ncbi:hypothetical protein MMC11_000964 [Xylographa trunciseda]|nr:hypothetical protein [Xylographa trunciseda]
MQSLRPDPAQQKPSKQQVPSKINPVSAAPNEITNATVIHDPEIYRAISVAAVCRQALGTFADAFGKQNILQAAHPSHSWLTLQGVAIMVTPDWDTEEVLQAVEAQAADYNKTMGQHLELLAKEWNGDAVRCRDDTLKEVWGATPFGWASCQHLVVLRELGNLVYLLRQRAAGL